MSVEQYIIRPQVQHGKASNIKLFSAINPSKYPITKPTLMNNDSLLLSYFETADHAFK